MKTTTGTANNDVVKGICFSARRILGVVWLTLLAVCSGAFAQALPDAGMVNRAGQRSPPLKAGIGETTRAYEASVADYNGDGRPDFLFNRGWGLSMRLYRNNGNGSFVEDLSTDFGIKDRLDCAWADVNQDNRVDFYCAVGANYGTAVKANQLWIQQPKVSNKITFKEQAAQWAGPDPGKFGGVLDRYGRGRRVTFFNFNKDKYPDLFVGNEGGRPDGVPSPNRVFVNVDGRRFDELTASLSNPVTAEIGAQCAFAADIDGDGFDDLMICGSGPRALKIYRNDKGKGFTDVAGSPGLQLSKSHQDVVAADLDRDGKLDLVLVSLGKLSIRFQTGTWKFGPAQIVSWTSVRAVAVADVDGDGWLDVYAMRSQYAGGVRTEGPNPFDLLLRNPRKRAPFSVWKVGASTTQGRAGTCEAINRYYGNNNLRAGILMVNSLENAPGPLELMILP